VLTRTNVVGAPLVTKSPNLDFSEGVFGDSLAVLVGAVRCGTGAAIVQ
jgi:hypothetical protein